MADKVCVGHGDMVWADSALEALREEYEEPWEAEEMSDGLYRILGPVDLCDERLYLAMGICVGVKSVLRALKAEGMI